MKILIAYSSKTNNTKLIAEKLKEYNEEATLLPISNVLDVEDYDLIYVGGWIDKGTYNQETLKFIERIKGKNTAFFFTLGAYPNSVHAYDCIDRIKKLFDDNLLLGHYHCQGSIDSKLTDWMYTLPQSHPHYPNDVRIKRWEDAKNHPNEEDFNSLLSFQHYIMNRYNSKNEN